MRQSTPRRRFGVAAAAAVAIVWASAAVAAPGGEKHCGMARGWVQDHCGNTAKVATSRKGTPTRCARALAWVDEHCSARADASAKHAYRSKARDYRDYDAARYAAPRHRKHAHKVRTRVVYVYVERPRRCCYSVPLTYYRTTPYKDQVFATDFILRPGKEAAFFRAYEANVRWRDGRGTGTRLVRRLP